LIEEDDESERVCDVGQKRWGCKSSANARGYNEQRESVEYPRIPNHR